MGNDALTFHSITSTVTTAGAAEQTANISLDGAVAAATISISVGSKLFISDLALSGAAAALWKLQQANDGVTFFDVGYYSTPATAVGMVVASPKVAYVVDGNAGATVVFRLRVTTAGGAAAVLASFRAYTQP
jgi:hypothetical protein